MWSAASGGGKAHTQQPPAERITPVLRTQTSTLLVSTGRPNPLGRGLKHAGCYYTEPQEEQSCLSLWFQQGTRKMPYGPDTMLSLLNHILHLIYLYIWQNCFMQNSYNPKSERVETKSHFFKDFYSIPQKKTRTNWWDFKSVRPRQTNAVIPTFTHCL